MNLGRFPRVRLGHGPTPLEPLERLSRHLGGRVRLWIKRDDCTGLATGGNKTRKLEYLLADALAQGADTLITMGATQSNHARQTVAAAAKAGLACHLMLDSRAGVATDAYKHSGNMLLNGILGAQVHHFPAGTDMPAQMLDLAERLKAEGRKPYVIPGGGSNPVGAMGYVNAALELVAQASAMDLRIDHLVHATGSSGTQAGLVTGLVALNAGIPVLGFTVRQPREVQEGAVLALAEATAQHLGLPAGTVRPEHVVADSHYVGQGYGVPTEGMVEAVRMLAEQEGILLDPVYSGKAMAGLIDYIRQGKFAEGSNVVFLHTGGSVGLFGYPDAFS